MVIALAGGYCGISMERACRGEWRRVVELGLGLAANGSGNGSGNGDSDGDGLPFCFGNLGGTAGSRGSNEMQCCPHVFFFADTLHTHQVVFHKDPGMGIRPGAS